MKRIIITALILLCTLITMIACNESKGIIDSLGNYDSKETYSYGSFQDYTDYEKYYFTSVSAANNDHFKQIADGDTSDLYACLDDFENLIRLHLEKDSVPDIAIHYDFDRSIIDDTDYFYLECKKTSMDDEAVILTSYDIYFFDTQSKTLYYFHNNI